MKCRRSFPGVRYIAMAVILCLGLTACNVDVKSSEETKKKTEVIEKPDEVDDEQWLEAETTPLGKYPETVIYTMAKPHDNNNSNMPAGDTYEDNNYTRYLLRMLNVQNKEVFEITEWANYGERLKMQISEKEMPDVMAISDKRLLETLVNEDLLEDLSSVYEQCASERIKDMYQSVGEDVFADFTFDGKLMAMPAIKINHGIDMVWLRKDWIDKLGLKEPQNWEELYDIIEKFAKENPGKHSGGNVGLAFSYDGLKSFSLRCILESKQAFPNVWYPDDTGKLVNGYVQEGMKEALKLANELYERGILDSGFMMRKSNNIMELIDSGQCGAVCGGWWMPTSYLRNSHMNLNADWKPYIFPSEDGKIYSSQMQETIDCIIVRKGFEHPEIVPKILTAIYDYARYEGKENASEVREYLQLSVGQQAMPLCINVDYRDSVFRSKNSIVSVWDGDMHYEDLSLLEQTAFDNCQAYKEDDITNEEAWATYSARITAVQKNEQFPVEIVNKECLKVCDIEIPEHLDKLIRETFIKMITGEKEIDEFDDFVSSWYENGGKELEEKINKLN